MRRYNDEKDECKDIKLPIAIEKTSLLLVEGKDECNFFKSLFKSMNITDVQILDVGGKEKFEDEFSSVLRRTGFSGVVKLGFVRDAEQNVAKSAFDSICHTITKKGIFKSVPCDVGKVENIEKLDGTGSLRIGIFIMPNNKDKDMLENLCLQSIEGMHCQKEMDLYMECLKKYYETKPSFNFYKAKALVYLASKVPIVSSLGLGAEKGYFDFNHSAFTDIKRFLSELFG